MNIDETAIVLDRLGTAYRVEVPPEALQVWSDQLAGVDPDVALDAAENVIGLEDFFPTVAVFRKEVAAVLRQRAKDEVRANSRGEGTPRGDCDLCAGLKWYESEPHVAPNPATGETEVFEMWKPCPYCAPVEHARWLEHTREVGKIAARRKRDEDALDLTTVLAEAKARLAETKPDEKAEQRKAHEQARAGS